MIINQSSAVVTEESANIKLNLGTLDVWCLGITIVIGGQYFSWNTGLSAGFGSYLISTVLMGIAYICLCFCNAEISSALPFAGGAYGISRVTLGLYAGFIVGILEACEYIAYVASSALVLSNLVCLTTMTSLTLVPVYSLVFFIVAVSIQIGGGRWFWWSSSILAVMSISILLIYNLGSLKWTNIIYTASPSTTGGDDYSYFIGGVTSFIKVTPLAAWWYVGIEALNLGSPFVANVSNLNRD
jgi:ethanolamine permease